MQYVWQHRLWKPERMLTVDGRQVRIIDPGRLNTDAGPDFFNAKIWIDGRIWAGDVEIHVRASDWHRHGHDSDRAYDSVILHVVDRDDTFITRPDGEVIPQLRMPCNPEFHRHFSSLVERSDIDLPCAATIASTPRLYITDWLSALAYERVYQKADHVDELVARLGGDWESACYVTLARALGFGINGEPFERLALSLPLRFIGKHSDSLTAIEALLMGQSGLLDSPDAQADAYGAELTREYRFLAHKFGLRRPERLGWKMSRMRPANFPHRRIAALASMLHGGFRLMNGLLGITDAESGIALLNPPLTGYWTNHYTFGPESERTTSGMSRSSAISLVINVAVPLMFAYGRSRGDSQLTDRAMELLAGLPAERNSVIQLFERAGIKASDAFTTQALIQMRRCYCQQRKCLYCRIGHRQLAGASTR